MAPEAADAGGPWVPLPYRVAERRSETPDTATLELTPAGPGESPPVFAPGQFNMVYVFGVGEAAISIAGTSPEGRLRHTVRAVGRVSEAICAQGPGAVVGVRGPYGTGWPLADAVGRDVLLVAGGSGLPPLRPVLEELLRHRDRYGRVEVVYGARTPRDLVYYPEIQTWRARSDLRFQTTVDAAGADWYGDIGVVTTRLPDVRIDPARSIVFLCGPEIMMRLTAAALEARGVPPGAIYLSMERNMKCAVGLCGHCQWGPAFVCRNGPVFRYAEVRGFLETREL